MAPIFNVCFCYGNAYYYARAKAFIDEVTDSPKPPGIDRIAVLSLIGTCFDPLCRHVNVIRRAITLILMLETLPVLVTVVFHFFKYYEYADLHGILKSVTSIYTN